MSGESTTGGAKGQAGSVWHRQKEVAFNDRASPDSYKRCQKNMVFHHKRPHGDTQTGRGRATHLVTESDRVTDWPATTQGRAPAHVQGNDNEE